MWAEVQDFGLGEVRIQSHTAAVVKIVGRCRLTAMGLAKAMLQVLGFVEAGGWSVDGTVKRWVGDVDFSRVDADYGTFWSLLSVGVVR